MQSPTEWEFLYVLPNLVLPSNPGADPLDWPTGLTLDSDLIAIVRNNDPRVSVLRDSNPSVVQILESFKDQVGKPYDPAVLLVRVSAPDSVRKSENAIVGFRNAVAFAFLLPSRAAAARGYGGTAPTWSDTFDFHPAQLSRQGRAVIQSPAILGGVSADARLLFSHSPYVSLTKGRVWPDSYLYRCLGREWRRRYVSPNRNDLFGRALFRSLEVAYQACAVGAKIQDSIYDYGIQVALWVSAMEILAWPSRKHADIEGVLTLLAAYEAHPTLARRHYRERVKGTSHQLNAVQRSYTYLYRARNHFLHGNPVSEATLVRKARTMSIALPRLAAIVYRAALVAYLSRRYSREITTLRHMAERAGEMIEDLSYDEALADVLGIELRQRKLLQN